MAKKLINRLERTENQQNSKVEPDVLRDYSVGAFLTDEENRTLWVNGMPYGNAYISFDEDGNVNTIQPKHAEIFNDFENNTAEGNYSHAEGGAYKDTFYSNAIISETATAGVYSVKYSLTLLQIINNMATTKTPLLVYAGNELNNITKESVFEGNISELESDYNFATINELEILGEGETSTHFKSVSTPQLQYDNESEEYIIEDTSIIHDEINNLITFSFVGNKPLPQHNIGKNIYFHFYYKYTGEYGYSSANEDGAHAENVSEASGIQSHSEGFATKALADYSHAEGVSSEAYGFASHVEGDRNITTNTAPYAHAEGHINIAAGDSSHAEGFRNKVTSRAGHAEGYYNEVVGNYAHAEGSANKATAQSTHAEGRKTVASGNYAHSEGNETVASGYASHAEGNQSKATNTMAHAEGYKTTAAGRASHTEGIGTITINEGEHAEGRYNYTDAESGFISTVGIGSEDIGRKNAISITNDGRIYIGKTTELVNDILTEYNPCLYSGTQLLNETKSLQRILAEAEQKLIEISYNQLVRLKDNGLLIPGSFYKITDYNTSIDSTLDEVKNIGAKSAGYQFDIIVLATSKNTLNENAYADYKLENTFDVDKDIKLSNGTITGNATLNTFSISEDSNNTPKNRPYYTKLNENVTLSTYFYNEITTTNGIYPNFETLDGIFLKDTNSHVYVFDYDNYKTNPYSYNRFIKLNDEKQLLNTVKEITFELSSSKNTYDETNFAYITSTRLGFTYATNFINHRYKFTLRQSNNTIIIDSSSRAPVTIKQIIGKIVNNDYVYFGPNLADNLLYHISDYLINNLTDLSNDDDIFGIIGTALNSYNTGQNGLYIVNDSKTINDTQVMSKLTISENNVFENEYIFPNIVKIINNEPVLITDEYIQSNKEYYAGKQDAQKPNFNLPAWKIKYTIENNALQSKHTYLEHITYTSTDRLSYFRNDAFFNINNFILNENKDDWAIKTADNLKIEPETIKKLKYKWDGVDITNIDAPVNVTTCILSNNFIPLNKSDESYFAYLCTLPNSEVYNNVLGNIQYSEYDTLKNFKTIRVLLNNADNTTEEALYDTFFYEIEDLSNKDEYGKTTDSTIKKWYSDKKLNGSDSKLYVKTYTETAGFREKTIIIPYSTRDNKYSENLLYNEGAEPNNASGIIGFNIINVSEDNDDIKTYVNKIQYKENAAADTITYLVKLDNATNKPQIYKYNDEDYYIYEAFNSYSKNTQTGKFEKIQIIGNDNINTDTYLSSNDLIDNMPGFIDYYETYIIAKNKGINTNAASIEIDESTGKYNAYIVYRDTIESDYFIDYELNHNKNITYNGIYDCVAYDLEELNGYKLSCEKYAKPISINGNDYEYYTYKYNKIIYDDNYYSFYKNENENAEDNALISNMFDNDIISIINTTGVDDFVISISKICSSNNYRTNLSDAKDINSQQEILKYNYLIIDKEITDAYKYVDYYPLNKVSTGYIYQLIDEYNNSFNYDVSNIMFKGDDNHYHYTFCKSSNYQNEYNALIDGNIRNNTFLSENILTKNIFYTKNLSSDISLLNNTFKNTSIICTCNKDIDIINSQFTNVSGIFSVIDNNVSLFKNSLSISNSLFSNCVNKTFKNSTYNGVIIRDLQDKVEYNGYSTQLNPIFSINNFRVYENTTSSFLNANIYDDGQKIESISATSSIDIDGPVAFNVTGQVNKTSKNDLNYVQNSNDIEGFNISYKVPTDADVDYGMLLKDNTYIDLGYLTIGFVYYWDDRNYLFSSNRADIELKASDINCTYTYTPTTTNIKSGSYKISYPNAIVVPDADREKKYKMSLIAHLGVHINDLDEDYIKDYYGKKYLMLPNSSSNFVSAFEFKFKIPTGAIRIQSKNQKAYDEVKPNITDIRWTVDKPDILSGNIDIKNITYVQKVIDTAFDYDKSITTTRSITLPDNTDYEPGIYSITKGSTDSMFAICTDGIVIKNTNSNYITAQITEVKNNGASNFYPAISIIGNSPSGAKSYTLYSNGVKPNS